MRCVTFLDGKAERLGFLAGEDVLDPLAALPGDDHAAGAAAFRDLPAFIRAGDNARALAGLRLAPPLRPFTVLCTGSNYRAHNRGKANTPLSGKEPEGTAWSSDRELGGTWHPAPGLVAATRYCEPGDQVESEITGIGVLRNPVVAG